jgi:hypothetical protein
MESLMQTVEQLKGVAPTPAPGLTMDGVLQAIEGFGQEPKRLNIGQAYPLYLPRFGGQVNMIGGITIRTSDYMGERVQVRFPKAPRGPYQRRRQKRMDRDPRNWITRGKGEYFLVDGKAIWCHPDDLKKLQESV